MESEAQQRDRVYCHQCESEWYRDEGGLECPECHSDFTEVIEAGHDPREELPHEDLPHLFEDHNPWQDMDPPDPDEDDITNVGYQTTGPHSMHFHTTFTRTITPDGRIHGQQQEPGLANPIFESVNSMMQNILGVRPQQGAEGQTTEEGSRQDTPQESGRPRSAPGIRGQVNLRVGGGPGYTWTIGGPAAPNGGPQDANRAQPPGQQLNELPNILDMMFGLDAGGAGGAQRASPFGGVGGPVDPFQGLFAQLFDPANMQHGDAVYSQEAMDRIVSQLMEQNTAGSAPGPATVEAIASLPKKQITEEDLGESGTAECSICMDAVPLGGQVTLLPCGHWFHGDCIRAWLTEHDTCPHCRQGIMPKDAPPDTARPRQPGETPRHDQMWGQEMQGAGTADDPWTVPDSPVQQRATSDGFGARQSSSAGPSTSRRDGTGNEGLMSRMRNAFGGSNDGHGQ